MYNHLIGTVSISKQYPTLRDYLQYEGITTQLLDFFEVEVKNENTSGFELHYKYSDGRIKQCRPNSFNKWTSSKPEQSTSNISVFGLKQLPENGNLLILAAGEKDTLSLQSIGIPAICFNSETSNIEPSVIADLKQRFKNLVILYDNDEIGIQHANKHSLEHKIAFVILPKGDYGKDLTDFLASGRTKEAILEIIENCIVKHLRTQEYYNLGMLDEMNFPEDEYIIPQLLPYDCLCALVGGSDSGKSLLALQFSIYYTLEKDVLGLPLNGGKKVLYIPLEDSKNSIRKRVKTLSKRLQDDEIERIKKNIFFNHSKNSVSEQIEKHLSLHPDTGLVIVDTFAELSAGKDINSSGEVRSILRPFHELCLKHEIAIIFIHHIGKSSERDGTFSKIGIVGSQAFEASMRTVYEIKKETNGSYSIAIIKGNDIHEESKSAQSKVSMNLNTEDLWFDKITSVDISSIGRKPINQANWGEIFDGQPQLKTAELTPIVASALQVSEKTAQNTIARELGQYRIAIGTYRNPTILSPEETKNFQL